MIFFYYWYALVGSSLALKINQMKDKHVNQTCTVKGTVARRQILEKKHIKSQWNCVFVCLFVFISLILFFVNSTMSSVFVPIHALLFIIHTLSLVMILEHHLSYHPGFLNKGLSYISCKICKNLPCSCE